MTVMASSKRPDALNVADVTPGCSHCAGLTVLAVQHDGATIGTIRSDYPWHLGITAEDTLDSHPDTPHYDVEWAAYAPDGQFLFAVNDSVRLAAKRIVQLRCGSVTE